MIGKRVPVQCSPTLFPADQDRLYQNLGDGRFADVTETVGIVAANGKGMAAVIADFDGSQRLNVFVANDTTANFYFVNRTDRPGAPLRIVEQVVQTGLAYDATGNVQSSMATAGSLWPRRKALAPNFQQSWLGRAVARLDVNRDGLPDLAVTHVDSPFALLVNESRPSWAISHSETARRGIGS